MAGLVDSIFRAIEAVKRAIEGIAIDAVLRKRTKDTYVPGQSQTYSNVEDNSKGVIGKYKEKEIDGNMIKAGDVQLILFPFPTGAIPETNDYIIIGGRTVRVVLHDPVYAGSEIALHVVQGRPV